MQPYDAGRNGIGWVPERAVVECVVRFRSHGTGSMLGRGQGRFLQPLTCLATPVAIDPRRGQWPLIVQRRLATAEVARRCSAGHLAAARVLSAMLI
jgi:hypothetical protein